MQNIYEIFIAAGEASGDAHAAKLVKAFKEIAPDAEFRFFGAAGPKMREAGVEAIAKSEEMAIVGLLEIAVALPHFWKIYRNLIKAAEVRKPRAAILVDHPDFNLKLARRLKKLGIKVFYYISPQIWAWRSYRLARIKKSVDHVFSILPFEKGWYQQRGYDSVTYVGNPLVREVHPIIGPQTFRLESGISDKSRCIALLPGSRKAEIINNLPIMLAAAKVLLNQVKDLYFFIAAQEGKGQLIAKIVQNFLKELENQSNAKDNGSRAILKERLKIIEGNTYDVLASSEAAAVTSGTATLECALIGTPQVIVYKTSTLNYSLLRPLIKVPHFGLVNLIAEKRLAVELIQRDFTPQRLAEEINRLIEPSMNQQIRLQLEQEMKKLGPVGASKRVAEAILELIADG